jgi:hypothetical protein
LGGGFPGRGGSPQSPPRNRVPPGFPGGPPGTGYGNPKTGKPPKKKRGKPPKKPLPLPTYRPPGPNPGPSVLFRFFTEPRRGSGSGVGPRTPTYQPERTPPTGGPRLGRVTPRTKTDPRLPNSHVPAPRTCPSFRWGRGGVRGLIGPGGTGYPLKFKGFTFSARDRWSGPRRVRP